jgi:hypothetical protein
LKEINELYSAAVRDRDNMITEANQFSAEMTEKNTKIRNLEHINKQQTLKVNKLMEDSSPNRSSLPLKPSKGKGKKTAFAKRNSMATGSGKRNSMGDLTFLAKKKVNKRIGYSIENKEIKTTFKFDINK